MVAWLVAMGVLIFQRDIGSAALFFGLFMAMIYLATSRLSWLILGVSAAAVGAVIAASLFPHVQARVDGWIHAFDMDMIYAEQRLPPGGTRLIWVGLRGFGSGLGQGRPDMVFCRKLRYDYRLLR